MTDTTTVSTPETRSTSVTGRLRGIGALLCAVVLGGAMLVGCGGEATAEGDRSTESSAPASDSATATNEAPEEQTSDTTTLTSEAPDSEAQGDTSPRDELPEGYPDDVPLPEFTSAKKIGGSADLGFWSIVFTLQNSTDTPVEDYAAQLEAAGYTVEDGASSTEATNGTWDVSVHSAMSGTLTIAVMES